MADVAFKVGDMVTMRNRNLIRFSQKLNSRCGKLGMVLEIAPDSDHQVVHVMWSDDVVSWTNISWLKKVQEHGITQRESSRYMESTVQRD